MDFSSGPVWCPRLYPRFADNLSLGHIGIRWGDNKRLFRRRRGFCDSCWGLLGANKAALGRNINRPSDVAGVYGAAGAGLAIGGGARAIVLTNQKGAVLELSGQPGGLMANVDLSGLAITLK